MVCLHPKSRKSGKSARLIRHLEYENLVTSTNLGLAAQESITGYTSALIEYLKSTKNQRQALKLFQDIEKEFVRYPAEKLVGSLGDEYVNVIGNIANEQLKLKQYSSGGSIVSKIARAIRIDKGYC